MRGRKLFCFKISLKLIASFDSDRNCFVKLTIFRTGGSTAWKFSVTWIEGSDAAPGSVLPAAALDAPAGRRI